MADVDHDRLPRPYRLALRLRELGVDDSVIADCLDVDPRSVPPLLDIAERKLHILRRAAESGR